MFRPTRFFATAAMLTVVVLFGTAKPGYAQRGPTGGGGGGGGGSGFGGHPGYGYGGFGRGGYGRGGYGYGYGGFYGDFYLGGPYYYGAYPYYYGDYPYSYPVPVPVPYYQQPPVILGPGAGHQADTLPMPQAGIPATIQIRLPADAEIWFDNHKTTQQGSDRIFATPPLPPGKSYPYEIRATWMVNGEPTTQTRVVQVEAGKQAEIDFLPVATTSAK